MKKKNAFTLVELIGTILLLGVIFAIVRIAYININESIRLSYYKTLEESIIIGGGEYFTYNKGSQPKLFGEVTKISVDQLVNNKYITEVMDRKGNNCDLEESYVGAYRTSYDKIDYYVCLVCWNDDYSSNKEYCNNDDNISYSLSAKATIGNTNRIYQEGAWVKENITLTFKTLNDIQKVNVLDSSGNIVKYCNLTNNNDIRTCSVQMDTSDTYKFYGVTNENKTPEESIKINIDKTEPSFDIKNSSNNSIVDKTILSEYVNSNVNINIKVVDINDTESGIKKIRYSFEESTASLNYVDVESIGTNINISKTFPRGKYKLVVEVTDNANNLTEKKLIMKFIAWLLHQQAKRIVRI